MKLFVAKLGSKATPSKPRSPFESTVSDTNGVGSKAPFFTTRNCPPCWQTKRRPSGAKAIAVGLVRPLANGASVKLAGNVAAPTGDARVKPARSIALASQPERTKLHEALAVVIAD